MRPFVTRERSIVPTIKMQNVQWVISALFYFASTFVGLTLLVAGVTKLVSQRKFIEAVRNYELLPARASTLVGRLLPIAEIVIGVFLISGWYPSLWLPMAFGLFLMFGGAVAINLRRGRTEISCGCFGFQQGQKLTWTLVARNVILAGLSALAWWVSIGLDTADHLSPQETIPIMFLAGATLISWLLWGVISKMWHIRLTD